MKNAIIALALACAGCKASQQNLYSLTKHDNKQHALLVCGVSKAPSESEPGALDCISYQTFVEKLIEQQEQSSNQESEKANEENQRGGYGTGEHRVFTL